jgi:integrase
MMTFIRHLKDRVNLNRITGGTLKNYYFAVKLFYEANDIQLNWKWIARGLPPASTIANDRIPTLEEIQKLIEYPDRRTKLIVYVMISSGIRVES